MKLYFIDEGLDKVGGVERIINSLANCLIEKYDIELISQYRTNDKPHFDYNPKIKINYLFDNRKLLSKKYKKNKIIYYSLRLIEKFVEYFTLKIKTIKFARRIKKDDIVVFGRVPTALAFLPYTNAKKVIVREAIHLEYHKNKNKIKKYFPQKVNLFIVSSDENMKSYKKFLGNSVTIRKIYNPLSITPKVIENIDQKVVTSIGRFDTHKGYDYLIRAFKKVVEIHPDWKLRIVGDGYYKENMVNLINNLKIENNITLVPASKNVVEELNKASIYVMASRFEGYANALVEAMSCGLSCISYNWLMGVEDIIEDNKNGIIVTLTDRYKYFKTLDIIEEDINNLAEAIINLIDDRKIRNQFKKEAPKIIKTRQKEKILKEWENIIDEK